MGSGYLFVYGTLMSHAESAMGIEQRRRLQQEGRSLGPATIAGRLYDLGTYPGLVVTRGPDVVHGEVFLLADAAASFRWLDPYESVLPGNWYSEYRREDHPVQLADGTSLTAWVYVLDRNTGTALLLPDGRWHGTSASVRRD